MTSHYRLITFTATKMTSREITTKEAYKPDFSDILEDMDEE
jgi:hypothetical protein